mmetsp:Transcript_8198/g.14709  ORF Transcript_8198/g.14709 Transcript_8198/m.14709 type:complete len:271 (-) Transcript_8198:66-878(-)
MNYVELPHQWRPPEANLCNPEHEPRPRYQAQDAIDDKLGLWGDLPPHGIDDIDDKELEHQSADKCTSREERASSAELSSEERKEDLETQVHVLGNCKEISGLRNSPMVPLGLHVSIRDSRNQIIADDRLYAHNGVRTVAHHDGLQRSVHVFWYVVWCPIVELFTKAKRQRVVGQREASGEWIMIEVSMATLHLIHLDEQPCLAKISVRVEWTIVDHSSAIRHVVKVVLYMCKIGCTQYRVCIHNSHHHLERMKPCSICDLFQLPQGMIRI